MGYRLTPLGRTTVQVSAIVTAGFVVIVILLSVLSALADGLRESANSPSPARPAQAVAAPVQVATPERKPVPRKRSTEPPVAKGYLPLPPAPVLRGGRLESSMVETGTVVKTGTVVQTGSPVQTGSVARTGTAVQGGTVAQTGTVVQGGSVAKGGTTVQMGSQAKTGQ